MEALLSAIKLDPVKIIEKVETIVNRYFERKDTAEYNVDSVKHLQRVYKSLNDALQGSQSSLHLLDSVTQPLMDLHANTVHKNLKTLEKLEPKVEKEGSVNRVKKTKEDLEKLEEDAREIKEFLCTTVAPILRESVKDSGEETYVRDNNVECNPPHLTLDYNTTSTCEGQLKASVLEDGGRRVVGVVAHGQGGVGKTCALRGLAYDDEIQERFKGGTLYLQLGADAGISTVIQGITRIVKRTGGSSVAQKVEASKTLQGAIDEASKWFRPHSCLFLIDDIWRVNGIDSSVLYALGTMMNEQSRVVYTTRDKHFLNGSEKEIIFSEKETHGDVARRMLLTHGGFDWKVKLSEKNESAVVGILEVCQGLPLALGVAGETVRRKKRARQESIENVWSDIYDDIQDTVCEGDAEGYGGVQQIVDTSLKLLDSGKENGKFSRMFRCLCVMEKQQKVPIGMLQKLWGLEEMKDTRDVVDKLDEVSVVRKEEYDGGKVFIKVHDVIVDIAKRKAFEKQEVKNSFRRLVHKYGSENKLRREDDVEVAGEMSLEVAAPQRNDGKKYRPKVGRFLRKLMCRERSGIADRSDELKDEHAGVTVKRASGMWEWWRCDDDGYIHENICRILQNAGYEKEVVWLLSKPQWTVSRLQKGGIYAVERDLEVGRRVAGGKSEGDEKVVKHMEMVGKAARMSCSFVNKNKGEAWFQIHGRLLWYATQCEMTKRFVEEMEECAPRPWAKASMGLLEQAGRSATDIIPVEGIAHTVRVDEDKVVCCWICGRTIGVTFFTFAIGVAETKKQEYEDWTARCCQVSQDLEKVVIGFDDGAVEIWDTRTGETKRCRGSHEGFVECVAMSADGGRVVSGSDDKSVRVWEVESGEPVGPPLVGHTGWVKCVAMSGDGERVVSGSWDKSVRVWEVESGEPVGPPLVGHTEEVTCVAMSGDGGRVVSGSDNNTVRVWEVGSGEPVGPPLVGHTDWVRCVAMSGDGERVVSGSFDKSVRVWEVGSGEPVGPPLVGHTETVTCVAMSGDGERVVSGSWDNSVRVWEVGSREPVGPPLVGHTHGVICVAMSGDGERVVSGSFDRSVRVWEVGSGELAGPPLAHNEGVRSFEVNEDGSRVVSYDYYGMGRVWRVAEGECELTSRDEAWDAALHALQQQGRWTTASSSSWYPTSREVTLVQPDGREVVLGTCERDIERLGETWFSRANFAHCKVER